MDPPRDPQATTPDPSAPAPAAGQHPAPRLTVAGVMAEIGDEVFSLDRGLPHTLLGLARSPGGTAWRYIVDRDARLTRPFRLALVMIAIGALVLHLSGAGAEFLAGLQDGARDPSGDNADDALPRVLALIFGRFDLLLVLCWVPAVAAAFGAAFAPLRPNPAEAVAFALYTLAGLLPIQLAVLLGLPALGVQPLPWMALAAATWLALAGHGYASRARLKYRGLRTLALATLSPIVLALLFVSVVATGVMIGALLRQAG